jgi:Holliday junction resolvasome RuvABC endonuclease subunit
MKILAIDASTKSSGIAYFNGQKLEAYDCFTASSIDLIKRIQKITNLLNEFLNEHEVEKIILEEVRPENGLQNIQTHRALMWLQAAIAFMVHDNYPKVEIEYVYPSSWRAACGIHTGRGVRRDSLKSADIKFVEDTYDIKVNDDIADAIGIGHAYVNKLDNEINWE